MHYSITEKDLRKEFEHYGKVKNILLVHDSKTGKFRGYAFVEFEHTADFKGTHFLFCLFIILQMLTVMQMAVN